MRKHFKSHFPAVNVMRRNKAVATDTVYSDTPSIDDGSKCAQIFVGRDTLVTDIYGMQTTFLKLKSVEIEAKLPSLISLPRFHPKDLIGRSFLSSPSEDGQTLRMRIKKTIADQKSYLDQHPEKVKFIVTNKSGSFEEICTYYNILEYLESDINPLDDPEDQ
jgi:hypothetical protein